MDDLIYRSALGIGKCNPEVFENKAYADGWNSAIAVIENAPVVDAVEVVRCKDCKHGIDSASNPLKRWCNQHATNIQNNDFCSYGERKGRKCG